MKVGAQMAKNNLDLLTGTEFCLVAEVPAAGPRWQQVHFNIDIARQYFNLSPMATHSITLEKISGSGELIARSSRQLVYPESNRNCRIEFDFGGRHPYPAEGRPLVVVAEADHLVYRYRTLLPEDYGYEVVNRLLRSRPSIGRGVHRAIFTLDELESAWPAVALRGSV